MAEGKNGFISLLVGGEPGVPSTKLDLRAQAISSDLRVSPLSVFAFCYIGFILHRLPTLTEEHIGLHHPRFKSGRIERCLISSSCWESLSVSYWLWWGNALMPEPVIMAREMELAGPESKSTPGVTDGSPGGFTL